MGARIGRATPLRVVNSHSEPEEEARQSHLSAQSETELEAV
jgi:hypothetical protein